MKSRGHETEGESSESEESEQSESEEEHDPDKVTLKPKGKKFKSGIVIKATSVKLQSQKLSAHAELDDEEL